MDDRFLTTDNLHRRLDVEDLPSVNRWRAHRGLRPLYLVELAERWSVPASAYSEKMRELKNRV